MRNTKRSPRQIAIGLGALALCGLCGTIINRGKDKDASSTATATVVAPAETAATTLPSDEIETAPAATEPPAAPTDAPPEPTAEPATAIPTDAAPVAPPATDLPAQTTEQQPAAPAAQAGGIRAEAGTCPDSHPIKGNINEREDTKIYHMPGSQSYRQTKPEECFATEADAQAAGYKPRQ